MPTPASITYWDGEIGNTETVDCLLDSKDQAPEAIRDILGHEAFIITDIRIKREPLGAILGDLISHLMRGTPQP